MFSKGINQSSAWSPAQAWHQPLLGRSGKGWTHQQHFQPGIQMGCEAKAWWEMCLRLILQEGCTWFCLEGVP